jgi:hypothetical protein
VTNLRLVSDKEVTPIAHYLATTGPIEPGQSLDLELVGPDANDVAYMLHDWLGGHRIDVLSPNHIRVTKL